NSHKLPAWSVHETAAARPPGTLPAAAKSSVPYVPAWSIVGAWGAIHVHWPEAGEYFHRSFRSPGTVPASRPSPPNNQKLPARSSHEAEPTRPPGTLPAAAVPCVPYTPE